MHVRTCANSDQNRFDKTRETLRSCAFEVVEMIEIKSHTISIPEAQLSDLKRRLRDTRWPDQLEGAGWRFGTELGYVRVIFSCLY